ncbi:MAG: hypothetical protein ABEI06_01410 [Halobacteriaceae archaeon]
MTGPFWEDELIANSYIKRIPRYNRHLHQKQDRSTSSFRGRLDNLDSRHFRVTKYRLKQNLDLENPQRIQEFLSNEHVLAVMDGDEIHYISDRGVEGIKYIENTVQRVEESITTSQDSGYRWLSRWYGDMKDHIIDAIKPWNRRITARKIPMDNNKIGHVSSELERIGLASKTDHGPTFYAEGEEPDYEMLDRVLNKLEGAEDEIEQQSNTSQMS